MFLVLCCHSVHIPCILCTCFFTKLFRLRTLLVHGWELEVMFSSLYVPCLLECAKSPKCPVPQCMSRATKAQECLLHTTLFKGPNTWLSNRRERIFVVLWCSKDSRYFTSILFLRLWVISCQEGFKNLSSIMFRKTR